MISSLINHEYEYLTQKDICKILFSQMAIMANKGKWQFKRFKN